MQDTGSKDLALTTPWMVLTLLRSAYTSEDKADNAILQSAMTLNVWLDRNSILWKPDDTPE